MSARLVAMVQDPVPVGLGAAAGMVDPTWQQFSRAVREQAPMVRRLITSSGRSGDLDVLMGDIQSRAWERLDAWRGLDPRPRLGAYVNGVAQMCVKEWRRGDMTKRGGADGQVEEIAADVADLPIAETAGPWASLTGSQLTGDVDNPLAEVAAALRVLHQLVISRPGGAVAWQRILSDALHDSRGQQLRTEIRLFLSAQLEGQQPDLGPRLQRIVTTTAPRPVSAFPQQRSGARGSRLSA